jgi:hypothetical protein
MKKTMRLHHVTFIHPNSVCVTYTHGKSITICLRTLIERFNVFAPLEHWDEFKKAEITDFGWSLEWPCGASLDSDRLFEMGLEQSGKTDTLAFRQWLLRHHFNLTQAAAAIGIARRTVSQYQMGIRPVPRYIELACLGWDSLHIQAA